MIALHRLGRESRPFLLNCDLVVTVEATPDTIITLTTGDRLTVVETPTEVRSAIGRWRAGILNAAGAGTGRGDLRPATVGGL
ncbi:MAG: flagellar FlbD family protein [Solirubrobacteraceae bacterium]|nr:flagellar FlbD family protein [Solirubrobacteraceae bacterium]